MNQTIPNYTGMPTAYEPRVLLIEDLYTPRHLVNQLFAEHCVAQVSCVADIYSACNALALIGFDFIVVGQPSEVEFVNDFIKNNPKISLDGIILLTSGDKGQLEGYFKANAKVFLVDAYNESLSDTIQTIVQKWQLVS